MKRVLILEDSEERSRQFKSNFIGCDLVIVETATEAIEKLKTEKWDYLFLDHDLGGHVFVESGGDEETGYDVAKFLNENPDFMPSQKVFTHSLNEAGRKNIGSLIPVQDMLFIWSKEIDFSDE